MKRKGVTVAGNVIVDLVKEIDSYPERGMLVKINNVSNSVGGCVPNTAINLVKIDRSIKVNAVGRIGDDENGRFILDKLESNGVDTRDIVISKTAMTSFDDVMSLTGGERTFFCLQGANDEFEPEDIDIDALECEIFHIGYILLLDKFDAPDPEYGTVMARFLSELQKHGIKTSVDVVSNSEGDYGTTVIPALRYCNFAIMNEIECCGIWGVEAYNQNGELDISNIRLCMKKMAQEGVRDKVVVHSKDESLVLDVKSGVFEQVSSLDIPYSKIKGSVGAGDAFCAGCLYGLLNRYSDRELLEFASAAAACSLFEANAVDGMKDANEIKELMKKYNRRKTMNKI